MSSTSTPGPEHARMPFTLSPWRRVAGLVVAIGTAQGTVEQVDNALLLERNDAGIRQLTKTGAQS